MKSSSDEQRIVEEALSGFQRTTGLQAAVTRNGSTSDELGSHPGPIIEVLSPSRVLRYAAVIKSRVDRAAMALSVREQFRNATVPPLLVTPYVAGDVARICRELGVAFIDCAGNAYLTGPDTFVFVIGNKPTKRAAFTQRPQRAFGATGLRIIYNCLTDPELFQASHREISKASGTALGTVSGILGELRTQGLIAEDKEGKRHWVSKERVIQAWMVNYPLMLRPKLTPRRFRARDESWWKTATPLAFGMQWGGEVAAAKLTGELIPKTVTLYAHEPLSKFVGTHRLVAAPQGEIEIVEAFWPAPKAGTLQAEMVAPLLIYADLIAIGDPRTIEIARFIYERHIA